MRNNTFMDNAAVAAVLAAIVVIVIQGAITGEIDLPLAGDPFTAEVRHA